MKKLLIIFTLLALMAGCGARKKDVQQSTHELDLQAAADTTAHIVEKTQAQAEQETQSASESTKAASDIEVGPGGSAVITEYDKDGNKIRDINIRDNGRTKNSNEQSKQEASTKSKASGTTDKESNSSGSTDLKVNDKADTRDVQLQRDGSFSSWWPVLFFAAAVYLYYRIRKKARYENDQYLDS